MATRASLIAYMQQTVEQYPLPLGRSLLPMHWRKAIHSGCFPSDGLTISPMVGPEADVRRSSSIPVITSGDSPYPYLDNTLLSIRPKPGESMTAPTLRSMSCGFCLKSMAFAKQALSHCLHSCLVKNKQAFASIW